MCHAGCKRPLTPAAHDDPDHAVAERRVKRVSTADSSADVGAMVQYVAPLPVEAEPVNAAPQAVQPAAAAAELSADAGALVLYVAPPVEAEPVDAVPLAARPAANLSADALALVSYVAPPIGVELEPINAVPLAAAATGRDAPDWITNLLLPRLRLRGDLPVIFVDEKFVTKTDLEQQQNRFRLPNDGALHRLRPILKAEDVAAADMLDEQIHSRRPATPPEEVADVAAEGAEQGKKNRKKKAGKKHVGLPVHVVAGRDLSVRPLKLSRWESSGGTVIKGDGYMDFIARCGFKVDDLVEIWAFKQHDFWNFGVMMCHESPLYMVMVKKDGEQRRRRPHCRSHRP